MRTNGIEVTRTRINVHSSHSSPATTKHIILLKIYTRVISLPFLRVRESFVCLTNIYNAIINYQIQHI